MKDKAHQENGVRIPFKLDFHIWIALIVNTMNLNPFFPARNRRIGFSEESVSIGDELGLYGQKHPKRFEAKVTCLYRDDEMHYTYRYDNGRTSLARSRRTDKEVC